MTVRVDGDDDDGGGHSAGPGSGPADAGAGGESAFEPLLVTLFLERDVVRGAGFKNKPVVAAGIMNGLSSLDTEVLDYRQAVALLDEASKLVSAAEALKAKAVARVCATARDRVDEQDCLPPAGPGADGLASMVADAEIRTVLDISDRAAQKLINHSTLLTTGLPATLDALARGQLKPDQATVIVDQCGTIPPEAFAAFEEQMVAFAPGRAKQLVADKGRRLREKTHPESITRRKQKAAADRTVALEPVEDGMCWLSMYLPAEAGVAAFNRLSALAGSVQGPDEARTKSQLRADIAADLLHTGTGTGHPPAALAGTTNDTFYAKPSRSKTGRDNNNGVPVGPAASGVAGTPGATPSGSGRVPNYAGIKAEVFVVVPVLTLMGLSDEPADLEGYGPIDEDTARELAVNAPSFKRLLTHPETGALLSYGRNRYGVPKDLQKLVRLRDRRCRGVGCNRAARTCEIDHSIPYPAGATEEPNLKAQCKRDHVLKTAKLWRDTQHRDGRVDWISPAGRKYTNTPDGPLPEMRPIPDIAHLIEKAKNQSQPPATAMAGDGTRENASNGETKPQADSGVEITSGAESKYTPGAATSSYPDDEAPPF
ncbi:13E12 repeat family protein [Arthrobacter pigmenti]